MSNEEGDADGFTLDYTNPKLHGYESVNELEDALNAELETFKIHIPWIRDKGTTYKVFIDKVVKEQEEYNAPICKSCGSTEWECSGCVLSLEENCT